MSDSDTTRINLTPNLKSLHSTYCDEASDRINRAKTIVPYGVSFLDDALLGIANDDLIIYCARTGAGKSQLALQIAINAAQLDKKVLLFALEATEYELARRVKFSFLYNHLKIKFGDIRFSEWERGLKVEDKDVDPEPWTKNINQVFRLDNFGVKELSKYILSEHLETDLIIIDHLHYLDLSGDNENQEIKNTVKEIRALSIETKKPIILISHVRKRDKFDSKPWPSLDDFHGSSDITKIATQAFSFGPARALIKHRYTDKNGKVTSTLPQEIDGTVMTILKNRSDSDCVNKMAFLSFNHAERRYSNAYRMVEWDNNEKTLKETLGNPKWAIGATNEPINK